MELRHLRYFVKAAELLHFTRAAESLFVSQPTLSTHIQQLEEEVGLALFDRTQRSVRLTEAGKAFLERAQNALLHLDLARERVNELKVLKAGTIRVAALLTFGQEVLPSWISTFNNIYPSIRIIVATGTSDFIEEEVISGNADLGLSFVSKSLENLQGETLLDEEVFLVVSENHPLAARKEIEFSELSAIPLALVSKQWTARRIIDSVMAENLVHPNVVIETDDLQALLQIVGEGNAAGLLAMFVISDFPKLKLIPLVGKPLKLNYGVVWRGQGHLSPPAQAFFEHIRQYYAKPKTAI